MAVCSKDMGSSPPVGAETGVQDHPVQTIMSRTGSFPVRLATELLRQFSGEHCIVLDPFCGKGTTLLAARILGLPAYGVDIAPEAAICSGAKIADVDRKGLQEYVDSLPFFGPHDISAPDQVRSYFHPTTLSQILSIRGGLLHDSKSGEPRVRDNAVFVLACLLGILHGHASFSLSIPSAHAYAMSSGYVARYALEHGLEKPVRDVRKCLITKIERCLASELPPPVESRVLCGSVLSCGSLFPELVGKVDVVLTSPPYLNAQTYAKDNWLRLWLLGHDYKELQGGYIQTGSIRSYGDVMLEVFRVLAAMLKPGGKLVCVAGDVRRPATARDTQGESFFRTGEFLAEMCGSDDLGFQIEDMREHSVPSSQRYLHSLSRSNGHSKRDLCERVFVATCAQWPKLEQSS